MTISEEQAFLDVHGLLEGFRDGSMTARAATELALARIDRFEARLNAFQTVDVAGARAAAEASGARWAAGKPCGLLDGVPLTIKDLTAVKGLPLRLGSATSDDKPAAYDAPSVARLREAGAVILGKTTTPEFGWKAMTDGPLFGFTRNPWDQTRTPGGSSGGAAAALAAGIGAVAHGTDGGGSIRIPASYCGLAGLKPSFGRVPHHPNEGAFCTTASQGPIARNLRDAALLLNVMAQPDPRDWYALPTEARDYRDCLIGGVKGMTLAYSPELGGAEPAAAIMKPVGEAVARLRDLGAEVVEVGGLFAPLEDSFRLYWLAGFARRIAGLSGAEREKLDPRLKALAEEGEAVTLADYDKAMVARAALGRRMNGLHRDFAALITPMMPTSPPPVETPYHSAAFDRWRHATAYSLPFNLTGQPAASIPCGVTPEGLPVGLQIVGPSYGEATVLRVGGALEKALAFAQPHERLVAALEELD